MAPEDLLVPYYIYKARSLKNHAVLPGCSAAPPDNSVMIPHCLLRSVTIHRVQSNLINNKPEKTTSLSLGLMHK